MPLIDITIRPGFRFVRTNGTTLVSTDYHVQHTLGPELPSIFARNSAAFGMGDYTPEDGVQVQVQFHRYSPHDINVADLWIKIQLSEKPPNAAERVRIRSAIFDAIVDMVRTHNLIMPDNFVLDVLWGPTSGCGSVNGTFIEW